MTNGLNAASTSILAITIALVATPSMALAQTAASDAPIAAEIVVTAQKRDERLKDVPAAVTAVSATQLQANGQITARDLVGSVPGLQVSGSLASGAFVIRGISSGQDTSPTVATQIDGVPIGTVSSGSVGAIFIPELDPSILQRVEVLRGPQGTLYGAATLGGIVNYVTTKPSLNDSSGSLYAESYATRHGEGSGSLRGSVNLPIIEGTLALQASAFYNNLGGYVSATKHGGDKFDFHRSEGGRVALLWQATPDLKIQISDIYSRLRSRNDSVTYDAATSTPVAGALDYTQTVYPDFNGRFNMAALNADYDLHWGVLSYVGSYQTQTNFSALDYASGTLASFFPILPAFGGVTVPEPSHIGVPQTQTSKKTTQELRLTSSGDTRLSWLVGLFYNHEQSDFLEDIGNYSPSGVINNAPLGSLLRYNIKTHLTEAAAFGNLTYQITPQFDVTGGLRVERVTQDFRQLYGGADGDALNVLFGRFGYLPTPADSGKSYSAQTVENYLFNARYRFNAHVMTYLRFATGYRPGGPNFITPGLPPTYKSDQTYDYEAGLKADFWGGKAYLDLSVFYINWKNIQILTASQGLNGQTNGGSATSKGVEVAGSLRPIHGLNLAGTLTYTDAHLNDDIPYAPAGNPTGQGAAGDRLPSVPKWSASLNADYSWPWFNEWEGFAAGSVRYVGARASVFDHSIVYAPYQLPSYTVADVRFGIRKNQLELTAFVRNVGDERAQLGVYTTGGTDVIVSRPRSYGASASYKF